MTESEDRVDVYIAVGASIEPRTNIMAALDALRECVEVTGVSTFYRTPAEGRPNDPDFLNGVFAVRTSMDARELKFDVLRRIEAQLGRERGADPCAPRTIDLDIVLYGDATIDEPDLKIPADDIGRPFVMVPLSELAPERVLPGAAEPLSAAARRQDRSRMLPALICTRALRKRWLG